MKCLDENSVKPIALDRSFKQINVDDVSRIRDSFLELILEDCLSLDRRNPVDRIENISLEIFDMNSPVGKGPHILRRNKDDLEATTSTTLAMFSF